MLILSFDSTGASCSACLWRDGTVVAFTEEKMERGQDQRLLPIILDMMKKADCRFENLDRIAVTRGPGSFTGLRLGLAAARGLGLATRKPVLGINRFDLFYHQIRASSKTAVLVVLQSKRKELFCRFYSLDGSHAEPFMMLLENIPTFLKDKGSVVIGGDYHLDGPLHSQMASEKEVLTAAYLASQADTASPVFLPRPLYIRDPDVTLKTKHLSHDRSVDKTKNL